MRWTEGWHRGLLMPREFEVIIERLQSSFDDVDDALVLGLRMSVSLSPRKGLDSGAQLGRFSEGLERVDCPRSECDSTPLSETR